MSNNGFTFDPEEREIINNGISNTDDDTPEPKQQCFDCKCKRNRSIGDIWKKDKRLLRSIAVIVILLNIPFGRYILYPFLLFSTWIHEMCHGTAALLLGGRIVWLKIFPDGSGLAFTSIPSGSNFARGFVASAGYQGTAIIGGIMLMFRRVRIGARIGTAGLGIIMLFSCAVWVRNPFGLGMLIPLGLCLVLGGWKAPPFFVKELYALLASTCCLNAITSIQALFMVSTREIGGQVRSSDAHTMQELFLVPSVLWAVIWMLLAFFMTVIGIVFVLDKPSESDSGPTPVAVQQNESDEDDPWNVDIETTSIGVEQQ
mmetsp:Transcript_3747/g.5514  ORF Transcript_3747/g.5514 Transcript_3747/m.5514 type:complete len:315 (-) Transcript_3747:274-1218(-)|eukprot:CAMPEP_0195523468 /NCGR_PEP_ID=MMETSP0794_2-20130614/22689_1 /TAXON_ID=515487 /ORGANISM="Stephanopyxis turris, Strain CCMP 815" /LENGTH=314 /DNA_ID=CAMNT_0040653479 /DNA_START=224 /DNA_END=1168 /DNA_ORIENTATION=+